MTRLAFIHAYRSRRCAVLDRFGEFEASEGCAGNFVRHQGNFQSSTHGGGGRYDNKLSTPL